MNEPEWEGKLLSFTINRNDKVDGSIKINEKDQPIEHNVLLPFGTSRVQNDNSLLSTSGSFESFSLINYKEFGNSNMVVASIPFSPIIDVSNPITSKIEELDKGLYLLKDGGLERIFVYKYDLQQKFENKLGRLGFDSLNWASVSVPFGSKGTEIADGKSAFPECKTIGKTRYFFDLRKPNSKNALLVGYRLALNMQQQLYAELVLKLFGLLLIPLVEFSFVRTSKKLSAKAKKRIFTIGAVIQVTLLLALVYFSFFSRLLTTETISDWITLTGQAITSYFMFSFKEAAAAEKDQLHEPDYKAILKLIDNQKNF